MSDPTPFSELLLMVGRVHQALEEALAGRFGKLIPSQALFLYKMGSAPVPFGELRSRGIHLGVNASHTVAKLKKGKYVRTVGREDDRRVLMVALTQRGQDVADKVGEFLERFDGAATLKGGWTRGDAADGRRILAECLTFLEGIGNG